MHDKALTPHSSPRSTKSQGTERDVAAVIARLLLHYYAPGDLSDSARRAIAQDWVQDLREFGSSSVADACREWRRTQTRRPTPADIRKLCIEAETAKHERLQSSAPSDGNEYARSLGYASEAERIAAIREDEADRKWRYEQARKVREELAVQGGLPRHVATSLGVKAREYTPDEMRRARIELGIEKPEQEEDVA